MKLIKSIFNIGNGVGEIKLKFMKDENTWHVLKGQSILYVGEKELCRKYINHLKEIS